MDQPQGLAVVRGTTCEGKLWTKSEEEQAYHSALLVDQNVAKPCARASLNERSRSSMSFIFTHGDSQVSCGRDKRPIPISPLDRGDEQEPLSQKRFLKRPAYATSSMPSPNEYSLYLSTSPSVIPIPTIRMFAYHKSQETSARDRSSAGTNSR